MLTRYWITFSRRDGDLHLGTGLGVGVTAYDFADAKNILGRTIFKHSTLPEIADVVEGVTFDQLDQSHVATNMGVMVCRGVWFPKGYSLIL
jgi:hypothetical protein